MSVGNAEKVTVFKLAEVRDCDPIILIHLIGVGRSQACFSCKSEFSNTVSLKLGWLQVIFDVALRKAFLLRLLFFQCVWNN